MGNKVRYEYVSKGEISYLIDSRQEFSFEYDFNISQIPSSILSIPFILKVLPLVWIYDLDLFVEELDSDFIDSIEEIKKIYSKKFPQFTYKGQITVGKVIKQTVTENENALLFTGNVEDVYSLIYFSKDKPRLLALSDNLKNSEFDRIKAYSSIFGLNYSIVNLSQSNAFTLLYFKTEYEEKYLNEFYDCFAKYGYFAPITYYYGIKYIYPGSFENRIAEQKSSNINLSDACHLLQFSGTKFLPYDFNEMSYVEKVSFICRYSACNNVKFDLNFCQNPERNGNRCICERCLRTIMAILAEGFSPNDYGFNFNDEIMEDAIDEIKSGKIILTPDSWKDIVLKLSSDIQTTKENILAAYLIEKYPDWCNDKSLCKSTNINLVSTIQPKNVLIEPEKIFDNEENSFKSVGMNTGNMLFRESLLKNLDIIKIDYEKYNRNYEILKDGAVILTDLIWINENSDFNWLYDRIAKFKNTKFVPMSVGLQSSSFNPNFKLNESVLKTLSIIQERSVIGVRGEYTAEILSKNGIKNIAVIGCPSLYYMDDPHFSISKKNIKNYRVCSNFRTFYGDLSTKEKHFLSYCANHNFSFIEQTAYKFSVNNVNDPKYFQFVDKWLQRNNHIFFFANEWKNYISNFDFSIGARFHGNVVALWNGIPSLFISIDSRTEELAQFFKLPYIYMSEFDANKPVEYYYNMADYTEFNKSYLDKYNNYKNFMKVNGII